jgi:hypothetical protein
MNNMHKEQEDQENRTTNGGNEPPVSSALDTDDQSNSEEILKKEDLKEKFKDGATPEGKDFASIFDSFFHLSENNINDLVDTEINKSVKLTAQNETNGDYKFLSFKKGDITWSVEMNSNNSLCIKYQKSNGDKKTAVVLYCETGDSEKEEFIIKTNDIDLEAGEVEESEK